MTNTTLQQIDARKSVRVFTDRPVTSEEKAALLKAAFMAPTAGNQQLYTIIDVTDQAKKTVLADLCDHQPFIATAPVVLVFLADCLRWNEIYRAAGLTPRPAGVGDLMLAVADACIAAQNVVVAAESLGLGSCYIGDVCENCEAMREALKLPETVFPAAMLVLGWPTQQQKDRKKPERFAPEYVVCENEYAMHTAADWAAGMTERAARQGTPGYDFAAMTRAFMERKYASEFSREMTRSVAAYLKQYKTEV